MEHIEVLISAVENLTKNDFVTAEKIMQENYPFEEQKIFHRSYSDVQKMEIFCRDGFIDLYSGKKLVNPAILRVLSYYFPESFPYHPHWKMTECHVAYWEFLPTIDHIYPIARGGADSKDNWATTSMLHNSIKSNWTLEDLSWQIHKAGEIKEWDGLSTMLIKLVEKDNQLKKDKYINHWYKITKSFFDK
ncbi:MAG: HNH endonuclease [Clostridia bacterium]|nr:HNH endonuclease [Clostridia bacterium]